MESARTGQGGLEVIRTGLCPAVDIGHSDYDDDGDDDNDVAT